MNRRSDARNGRRGSPNAHWLAADPGGIHSNAYNFLSAVQTGVDPRTGMYTCTVSLPGVAANNLCGPTMGVAVAFSPLNATNVGFGIGWALTTTRYDGARKRLSLSSGESFVVDTFVENKAAFKDRKLRTFDFIKVGVEGDYRIVHKSGVTELLKVLPGSGGIAALHEVRSPEGYAVMLDVTATNGVVSLRGIVDGTGRRLLDVTYEHTQTVVTLQPGTAQAAAFTFRLVNDRLVSIDLPDGYGDGWLFGYESSQTEIALTANGRSALRRRLAFCWPGRWLRVPPRAAVLDLLLLKNTTVPTGGREEVVYEMEGHRLPGPVNEPLYMPRVVTFHRYPGHGQPEMKTGYTYSLHNFFGYGELRDWMDDEDNLYRVVMPPGQQYEYSSTETQYDGDTAVRTVVRTFNRFHLMTSERTSQEGCVKEVATVYDEDPATSFERQPPWCQLPAEVRTTFSFARKAGALTVRDRTAYDEHGNVVRRTDARGASESFSYFPVEGEDGVCPADPLGFVRFLKQKRSQPPEGTDGVVRVTRFAYAELPSRATGAPYHIVSAGGSLYEEHADGRLEEWSETSQTYIGDGGEFHGRPRRVVIRHGKTETSTEYAYRLPVMEKDANREDVPTFVTDTTKSAGRGAALLQTKVSVALSVYSGASVMDQGPDGGIMRYAYDLLGRDTVQTVAADTEWEATTTSHYVLGHGGSGFGRTSVKGLYTYVALDGFGTPISAFVRDWNGDGRDHEIWRARFDALGRKVSETTMDAGVPVALDKPPYKAETSVAVELVDVALTTNYRYDGWGTCTEVAESNGLITRQSIDPVNRVAETWNEAEDKGRRLRGSRTRTTSTVSGKPWTVDVIDGAGALMWRRESTYDGLDRLVLEAASAPGSAGKITSHRYDFFDRLIETRLPDGALVTRQYAADTAGSRVTGVSILHPSLGEEPIGLGEQAYDSLGRRTWLRVGQRETAFAYATASSVDPETTTLPSGATITCGYERRLGGRLAWHDVDGDRTAYEYDKISGDLLSARNALGSQELAYEPSGRLAAETFRYEDSTRVGRHAYTLRGSPISYVIEGADDRRMIYDRLGRLSRLEGRDVVVDITYDAFSNRNGIVSRGRDGMRSMDVRLSLDEDGRELERVTVSRLGTTTETETLVPTYTPYGKLATRRLVAEAGERDEAFTYDIRGRLELYTCRGIRAPTDPSGRTLSSQHFTYDALDNVSRLEATYADGGKEANVFRYSVDDPTQLVSVEQEGHPENILRFSYDSAGNLKQDERGRSLYYDGYGRPTGWAHDGQEIAFGYGARDRIAKVDDGVDARHRYYAGQGICLEAGERGSSSFTAVPGSTVAQTRIAGESRRVTLLGGDALGSPIGEVGETLAHLAYTPHGYGGARSGTSDIGYTGELKTPGADWYVLGHYRAYNPVLLRFHSPDAASPFGHGGLNAYAYCLGDPVNRSDPTGEGWLDWLFVGIGVVASGVAIALSGGTLAPALGAVLTWSATLSQSAAVGLLAVDVASVGMGIGSAAAADAGNDALASKLAMGSMVLGLAGLGGTVAAKIASKAIVDTSRHATTGTALAWMEQLSSIPPIKAPTLVRSPPRLRLLGGAPEGTEPFMRNALVTLPNEAGMAAMSGVQRINVAVAFPHIGNHLVSKGFLSRELLNRFPQGIALSNGWSVTNARMTLSHALIGHGGLQPSMVGRSGFNYDELLSLNPSSVGLDSPTLGLDANQMSLYQNRVVPSGVGPLPGQALYRRFLSSYDPIHGAERRFLDAYAAAELRARGSGNWALWDVPTEIVD
jgi:RHS repeat-associated protein